MMVMLQNDYDKRYRKKIEELESDGKWTCIEKREYDERDDFKPEKLGFEIKTDEEKELAESITLFIVIQVCQDGPANNIDKNH